MFKNMKLGQKLIIAFLAVGVIPFAVVGLSSMNKASDALSESAFNQLEGVREIKKAQIEQFFAEREGDMGVLMDMVGTLRSEAIQKLEAQHDLKTAMLNNYFEKSFLDMEVFARSKDVEMLYDRLVDYHVSTNVQSDGDYDVTSPEYQKLWKEDGHNVTQFQIDTGYYDIFMICAAHGHVMYSAAKESDLGLNVRTSTLQGSGLHKVWKKTVETQKKSIVDFESYAPSNGEPASFVGVPIMKNGTIRGVMVVQLSTDHINKIMSERAGLGKTGETYLVGQDKLMRSDSFLDPVHHSVKGSFANPEKGKIDTEATRWALAGEDRVDVILDYNNNPVLSVAAPFKIMDITWAILAEIDIAEAYNPVDEAGKEFYAKYIEKYGYYDLFLINSNGFCFYTVVKEADYQTNFVNGKYASSNLGELTNDVLQSRKFGIADFAPYAPSNDEPAAFIAQPVIDTRDNEVEMVVALQLSQAAINKIMQQLQAWVKQEGPTWLAPINS